MVPDTRICTNSAKATWPALKYFMREKECILLWAITRPWSSWWTINNKSLWLFNESIFPCKFKDRFDQSDI